MPTILISKVSFSKKLNNTIQSIYSPQSHKVLSRRIAIIRTFDSSVNIIQRDSRPTYLLIGIGKLGVNLKN